MGPRLPKRPETFRSVHQRRWAGRPPVFGYGTISCNDMNSLIVRRVQKMPMAPAEQLAHCVLYKRKKCRPRLFKSASPTSLQQDWRFSEHTSRSCRVRTERTKQPKNCSSAKRRDGSDGIRNSARGHTRCCLGVPSHCPIQWEESKRGELLRHRKTGCWEPANQARLHAKMAILLSLNLPSTRPDGIPLRHRAS
jgi:hypothetical protein